MRILLTAGFDRALHAVALAELVRREGHEIAAILVVSPFRLARLREWVGRRGLRSLIGAARRALGGRGAGDQVLEAFVARHGVDQRSLSHWARVRRVALHTVADLNGPEAVRIARAAAADRTLYAGGGLLRAPFLEAAGGRVLNAHAGPLPFVRGMNACEWSLLLGHAPSVTIHWIDTGIDTGEVVETIPLPVLPGEGVEVLRGKCTVLGIEGLVRAVGALAAPLPARRRAAADSRQCFALAPVLRELLDARLEDRRCP